MTPNAIATAAEDLFEAERVGQQIGLLSMRHPQMSLDDAYAVQEALCEKKRARSAQIGWKIGLTSRAMQAALGITTPDSGILFDDMQFAHLTRVPRGRFIEPRIEAEIAFGLGRDLAGADVTREAALAATAWVAPSLEILDTRIVRRDTASGQARRIVDTVADNAANAGLVLGDVRHRPTAMDLAWVGAIVTRDGDVEETGLGAGVLGDPVLGLVWLTQRLARYGKGLKAGDVVLSGSFIRPIEAPPGTWIDADFGAFGQVAIGFD